MSSLSPTSQKWRTIISQGGLQEPPPMFIRVKIACPKLTPETKPKPLKLSKKFRDQNYTETALAESKKRFVSVSPLIYDVTLCNTSTNILCFSSRRSVATTF